VVDTHKELNEEEDMISQECSLYSCSCHSLHRLDFSLHMKLAELNQDLIRYARGIQRHKRLLQALDLVIQEKRSAEMSLDDRIRKKQRKIEDLDRRMKYMEKHKKLAGKIHGLHSDIDGVLEQVNEAEAHLEHTQHAVSMVEGDLDSLKGMVEELQDSR
jgi:chromosome segregation ATPase